MWQPIETAPKDGTRILVAGGEFDDEHWMGETGPAVCHWDSLSWNGEWVVSYFDTQCATVAYLKPTHWMPLPEPPNPTPA